MPLGSGVGGGEWVQRAAQRLLQVGNGHYRSDSRTKWTAVSGCGAPGGGTVFYFIKLIFLNWPAAYRQRD